MKASPYSRYAPGAPALTPGPSHSPGGSIYRRSCADGDQCFRLYGNAVRSEGSITKRRDRPAYPVSAQERERSSSDLQLEDRARKPNASAHRWRKTEYACPIYGYSQIVSLCIRYRYRPSHTQIARQLGACKFIISLICVSLTRY